MITTSLNEIAGEYIRQGGASCGEYEGGQADANDVSEPGIGNVHFCGNFRNKTFDSDTNMGALSCWKIVECRGRVVGVDYYYQAR